MTHEDRVWHHEMETLEGIHEHAERIASLEELVTDMWKATYGWLFHGEVPYDELKAMHDRMAALGLEPD